MIAWPAKDPAETLDFTWTPALDDGDTIATFAASVTYGTITKSEAETNTSAIGTVWIAGGADMELAMLSLTVTTVGGRTFREGAVLPVFSRASELLALFRLRYPAFAAVGDGDISYRLFEAAGEIGDNWLEAFRMPARTAWAAHRLAEAGAIKVPSLSGATLFRSGTFEARFADSVAGRTGFAATIYGREFERMRRACFAGPRLAWTPW